LYVEACYSNVWFETWWRIGDPKAALSLDNTRWLAMSKWGEWLLHGGGVRLRASVNLRWKFRNAWGSKLNLVNEPQFQTLKAIYAPQLRLS